MTVTIKCWACGGDGKIGVPEHPCGSCGGTGRIKISDEEGRKLLLQKQIDDAGL